MPPQIPIENEVLTSTQTIDKEGGWIITHYTHTWDRRERIDALQNELNSVLQKKAEVEAEITKIQAKIDAASTKTANAETEVTP